MGHKSFSFSDADCEVLAIAAVVGVVGLRLRLGLVAADVDVVVGRSSRHLLSGCGQFGNSFFLGARRRHDRRHRRTLVRPQVEARLVLDPVFRVKRKPLQQVWKKAVTKIYIQGRKEDPGLPSVVSCLCDHLRFEKYKTDRHGYN